MGLEFPYSFNPRNMKWIFLISINIILVGSCKTRQQKDGLPLISIENGETSIDQGRAIRIEIPEITESLLASEVFDSISFIDIETGPDCMIGSIKKIMPAYNSLYILDEISRSILCFTDEGKFRGKFQKIGKGPEEYSSISDFDINTSTKEIVLLVDNKDLIFLDYDLNFIRRKGTNTMASCLLCLNPTKIALYTHIFSTAIEPNSSEYFQLIVLDLESGEKTGYFPNTKAKSVGLGTYFAFSRSQELVLTYPLTNKYYIFRENAILEGAINFANHHYNLDQLDMDLILQNFLTVDNIAKYFHKFYFLHDWVFFTGIFNKRSLFSFVNLKTYEYFSSTYISNDINELPLLNVKGNFEEGLYFELLPSNYLNTDNINVPRNTPPRNFFDNPIILKCYAKQK
jgi:hypothetical protein